MRKMFLSVIIYHLSILCCSGQKYSISIGPNISLAKDAFKYSSSRSLGGGLDFSANLSPKGSVNLHIGFILFTNTSAKEDNVSFMPIRLGYQHFFIKKVYLFSDVGVGLLFFPDYSGVPFSFATGAGTNLPFKKVGFIKFQTGFVYTKNSDGIDYRWVTIQMAYGVKFGGKKK